MRVLAWQMRVLAWQMRVLAWQMRVLAWQIQNKKRDTNARACMADSEQETNARARQMRVHGRVTAGFISVGAGAHHVPLVEIELREAHVQTLMFRTSARDRIVLERTHSSCVCM